ncbi:unnamed protein product [Rotaria magnacalcarata]|uniref:Cytochrome c oxidase subunit 7C, mitochondrial n=2 Tax=Rotaria magnacalcarata TaxID=392030 RepID=A0A816EY67_9BILA|nr:unnamed protein product [Rotaria magnacalcarata]CAF1655254.1 unnamed protein product [Rotaria magnacalcarata]CAF1932085.1 unnamed protein product [Rotaria magnacalcarata]CAF2054483.1 unnamed protein product [Rotaria magnacalcarata]CAF2244606.1 unnamed protein product [Rotaria magnacalcarata]
MASLRPCLALVPRVVGRRQFSLTQRLRLKDNWDQECLPGANLPFDINNKWGLAVKLVLYLTSAVAVPFLAMRWQLLKKRSG